MYVLVRLLKGYPKPLVYKIPKFLGGQELLGKVVKVPLKNQSTYAVVLKTFSTITTKNSFLIKEINSLEEFPKDNLYKDFIQKVSKFYFIDPLNFYKRISNFIFNFGKDEKKPTVYSPDLTKDSFYRDVKLTNEQQEIINSLEKDIGFPYYKPSLIHGVTGSGKTEIYKKLIIKCIEKNKSVVFILPEVSLCIQFQFLLRKQLPQNVEIFGFHSATKLLEKKELWEKLLHGKPILLIGVHLPIVLPISNLGLIIVDEEHETGFQEKKHPKINSKEVAIWRAQYYKIPIILGSATPSLNSIFNVKARNWKFFQLKERFSGAFPNVEVVFLKEKEQRWRESFWICKKLEQKINQTLEKKEQVIIYLNRRGFCFFVQCKKCGFIFQCPNCSVSLTMHRSKKTNNLRCHYCNFTKAITSTCPECKTGSKDLLQKGIGTQQVVTILKKMFSQARIDRADLDSITKKRSWQTTVERFQNGEIDILVGTKLITKGYHFPKVTLVGILWADLNLHFPVFNSSETTMQQIIQVAGRAGRQISNSHVIVQAMHDHEIFQNLNEKDYLKFCYKELEFRKLANYPPFGRLIQIELKNQSAAILEKEANSLFRMLSKIKMEQGLAISLLGPARPIVYRIQKTESRQIFIKAKNFNSVFRLLQNMNFLDFDSRIFVVPTP
ncbi:primosomal protein N' [Candidatus Dependentiae bacterium]